MQAASMPNAIAFIAHRSRFHLSSKPLGFVVNHAILCSLYIVALILQSNHHLSSLYPFHPICLTIVSHQNLLYIGFSVEYLSAK